MAAMTIAMSPWAWEWATLPATDTIEDSSSRVHAYHACRRRARVAVVATMTPPSMTSGTIHAEDTPLAADSSASDVNERANEREPTATVPAVARDTGDRIFT